MPIVPVTCIALVRAYLFTTLAKDLVLSGRLKVVHEIPEWVLWKQFPPLSSCKELLQCKIVELRQVKDLTSI